ncbi:hypothetical protein FRC11_008774 [Ceratobasidium sp. 423]|nr:hypothetical protein FRC11_008774 [Ceratobasidium sp. 423]
MNYIAVINGRRIQSRLRFGLSLQNAPQCNSDHGQGQRPPQSRLGCSQTQISQTPSTQDLLSTSFFNKHADPNNGSDLELDIEGDSVIRDFGIDDDVEIHDANPDDGQELSILDGQDDDEAEQSWHTAPPFTPGNSFFLSVLPPDDLLARLNLTRTPSSRPTVLEELQPPKAKRRSMDHALMAGGMQKLQLTPSRSRHHEPAPEWSSPPETSSPASPTRKFRLGLPLPPCSHDADRATWDTRKLKSLKPLRRRIFIPPNSTNIEIPIMEPVPSTALRPLLSNNPRLQMP